MNPNAWPTLPCDPPDRLLARSVGGWGVWIAAAALGGFGLGALCCGAAILDQGVFIDVLAGRSWDEKLPAIHASLL